MKKKKKLIYVGLIVVSLALVIIYYMTTKPTNIDGITCDSLEQSVMHIHTNLSITINNNSLTVPASIGINDDVCLYWLHTHDTSGLIHTESPVFANYTLGQFIDIWNKTQPYSETLMFLKNSTITAYVNNVLYIGNYRNIILRDHYQIRLIGESS